MQTKIMKMSMDNAQEVARSAAEILKNGGLVAFPTETVYGLGGNGLDADASRKIYAAKGRPSDNPLILHIADTEQLRPLVKNIDERAHRLIEAFCPGPLTMIFPKADIVPYETTGGLDTVAVRMPSHPLASIMLKTAGIPVAAPSANTSGRPSPTSAEHVIEDMNGKIDMIIDGGDVGIGLESTIIDLSTEKPVLLRPGYITKEMLEAVIGPVEVDSAVYHQVSEKVHPKAPGMKYRHYAPRAGMCLVEGSREKVADYINREAEKLEAEGRKAGIMATDETLGLYSSGTVISVGSGNSADSIAHNLFRVLRDFDELNVDYIYSESFSDRRDCAAVMNRLMKAAGHHVVRVD